MTNFNEKVNYGIGYILNSQEFFIYRTGTNKEFARMIHDELYLLTNTYRLFIRYKITHRVKKIAGRCFLWDNSHGDHMADPGNGIELRGINDASQDDYEGFGNPRFDAVSAAIFITDQCVFVYGDTWIDAVSLKKEYVVCDAFVCGRLGGTFKIPAETFDRLFGLKENFPEQYEKVFGKTEEAKPVQEENDLIEEAKRGKMKTTSWTIEGGFGIIGEIFDELSHADRAWNACGWGESVRETIDEAIRTYKLEVEKTNKKIDELFFGDTTDCNKNCQFN